LGVGHLVHVGFGLRLWIGQKSFPFSQLPG
jgi:hypothetical protein